jgi:cation diffusion facilitator CzcD-associated flavoprotein CzcO
MEKFRRGKAQLTDDIGQAARTVREVETPVRTPDHPISRMSMRYRKDLADELERAAEGHEAVKTEYMDGNRVALRALSDDMDLISSRVLHKFCETFCVRSKAPVEFVEQSNMSWED